MAKSVRKPTRDVHLDDIISNQILGTDSDVLALVLNRLKQARRIATRYDKTAASFMAFLCLAASRIWLKDYVDRT